MRRIGILCCALALAVLIPMTLIRSGNTETETKHNTRDPTIEIEVKPPIILRPEKDAFQRPPYLVSDKETGESTAPHRPGEDF